jgi:hypothetical protein
MKYIVKLIRKMERVSYLTVANNNWVIENECYNRDFVFCCVAIRQMLSE